MTSIPTTIGRYQVERLVARGAMGQIYKAHDPDIGRPVAIKLISTELMSGADREEYLRRFRREAQAAGRCAHPSIVAVYDFAMHEGQPYLAMEFVEGVSLRQALDAAPVMSVGDAIHVMLQVLDALASAHALGVVHQDIKPANIMVMPGLRVKVADFGISRFVNTEVTSTGLSMGTPSYMSPEQCLGSEVDRRSDLFSAGATLYEMIAGQRAFSGRTLVEVSDRILHKDLPMLPSEVLAAVPRLQLALERAVAKQPDDRFASASEMAEVLRQILVGSQGSEREDATRIVPLEGAVAGGNRLTEKAPGPPLDDDTLQILERKLTEYVGPLARTLIRTAAGRSGSAAELCAKLAVSVRDGADRERFLREAVFAMHSRLPRPDVGASQGIGNVRSHPLPEREIERVQEALTQFVGPISRVLVRRAAANASSVESLWCDLANHIESPTERSAFLRLRSNN